MSLLVIVFFIGLFFLLVLDVLLEVCVVIYCVLVDMLYLVLCLQEFVDGDGDGVCSGFGLQVLIGDSVVLQVICVVLCKFVLVELLVLIIGEIGIGKELVVQVLYVLLFCYVYLFMVVNCGVILVVLVQLELFGYECGVFMGVVVWWFGLFEIVNGGMVLLDEIGDLLLDVQISLLCVLQEGMVECVGSNCLLVVDVCVFVVIYVDLEMVVEQGWFCCDLFYWFNVLWLLLFFLCECGSDIVLLVCYFLDSFCYCYVICVCGFSVDVLCVFECFYWLGNVCELFNCVQCVVIVVEIELISVIDLELGQLLLLIVYCGLYDVCQVVECEMLLYVLCQSDFNISVCVCMMQVLWVIIYCLCCKYQLVLLELWQGLVLRCFIVCMVF